MGTPEHATKTALTYEVMQAKDAVDEWIVEAIDYEGDGEVSMTRFSGRSARERAEEYAAWKNAVA